MTTATIRDLRMRFPMLKAVVAREGEVIVTDRGKPAFVLRAYTAPALHGRAELVNNIALAVFRRELAVDTAEAAPPSPTPG